MLKKEYYEYLKENIEEAFNCELSLVCNDTEIIVKYIGIQFGLDVRLFPKYNVSIIDYKSMEPEKARAVKVLVEYINFLVKKIRKNTYKPGNNDCMLCGLAEAEICLPDNYDMHVCEECYDLHS